MMAESFLHCAIQTFAISARFELSSSWGLALRLLCEQRDEPVQA